MVAQVLVDEQRVERGGIKTGQEHAHHNQQVDFLGFDLFGQIAVVVLKAVTVYAEVGFEQRVVVCNGRVQKLFGAAVHGRNIEAFVLNLADRILLLVGCKREDSGHPQRLVTALL
ncbi:hypothetical protein D3C85_1279650 [compost metagenome]